MSNIQKPPCKNCITLPICLAKTSHYRSLIKKESTSFYIIVNIYHHSKTIHSYFSNMIKQLVGQCPILETYCVNKNHPYYPFDRVYNIPKILNVAKIFVPNLKEL